MTLSADQFEFVRRLVADEVGMALEPDREFFVAERLRLVAVRHGWNHLDPLIDGLKHQHDRRLVQECLEALATHETSFFRDPHYFDELQSQILPRLIESRTAERRLTIWCAACSTGQEAYSIAMLLRERFTDRLRDWNIQLLATDLSESALQQARSGQYSDVEIQRGLSAERLTQHFHRQPTGWKIDDRLQNMVRFQHCNLLGTWPQLTDVDLVLLRNVLIYMVPSARQAILTRVQKLIQPKGHLMLGSTESSGTKLLSPAGWSQT